ncbi:Uu.00g077160.m01.CDS01 [Anthostomella pinea]|uniref:Uu.00g077160.m01.CDS01 n=1 Tax=Anthostomella pinea TaxID=933095 RepID=A0AAI8VW07_9PEZI|nr:Uu.00g077160.m01.CDS01 [Anthostomella pinea]
MPFSQPLVFLRDLASRLFRGPFSVIFNKLPSMDTSSTVAAWLFFAVTAVGLGGLISQANAISDQMDPFHATRSAEHLGIWFQRQRAFPWWRIAKPPPLGPVITASLSSGFCSIQTVHLVRLPLRPAGKASWAVLLSIIHSEPLPQPHAVDETTGEKGSGAIVKTKGSWGATDAVGGPRGHSEWSFLEQTVLVRHNNAA